MAAPKVAIRRVHTGTAGGEFMQRQAQQAAAFANSIEGRVGELELQQSYRIATQSAWTTTTNTAQPTGLYLAVEKGDLLEIEMHALAGVSGDALGMKWAIYAPANSTVSGVLYSSLTGMTDFAVVQITAINTLTSAVHTVNGGTRPDIIKARVDVRTDGEVRVFACPTTNGRTCTIAAVAYLKAERFQYV